MGLVNDGYGSFPANVQQTGIEFYDEFEVEVDDNGSTPSTSMQQYNGYFYEIIDLTSNGMGYAWSVYSQLDTDTTTIIPIATGTGTTYQSALSQVISLIDSLPVNNPDDPFESDEDLGDDPFEIGPIFPPIDIVDFDNLKPDNIGGGGSGTSPVFGFSAPTGAPFAYLGLGVIFLAVGSYFKVK